jgi:hypothetical protein
MAHGLGSGDKLARGAVSATYLTTEKKISDAKWDAMFEGFDPDAFQKKENVSRVKVEGAVNVRPTRRVCGSDAGGRKARVLCIGLGMPG